MDLDKNKRFYLEAAIEVQEETDELREAAASAIKLPSSKEKQPDLQYFTAIFVSTGANLNGAHFKSSELVLGENTIINKALDVEHKEEEIIGHLYDRAFITKDGKPINLDELKSKETSSLDEMELHVVMAGIIYKNRFPNLAEEVANGDWKVSMECYYQDYEVKIGDLIMTRQEAELLGITASEDMFGRIAKVIKNGKEIAKGTMERILRGILFSGCGIVKNPANPPSVILETAKEKEKANSTELIIIDYDKLDEVNKVTSKDIEKYDLKEKEEEAALDHKDTTGICISFKKRHQASEPQGPDTPIIHENWCALYEAGCTSFSRDTTDPKCLRNQVQGWVSASVEESMAKRALVDKSSELVDKLNTALREAAKFLA